MKIYKPNDHIKKRDEILYEIQCAEMFLNQVDDDATRKRMTGEIAQLYKVRDSILQRSHDAIAPDAAKQRKRKRQNQKNASEGGKAAAEKANRPDDAKIKSEFVAYKSRNDKHTYTTAEHTIAGKLGYSEPKKLGERIKRMTKMTPAKWYSTL